MSKDSEEENIIIMNTNITELIMNSVEIILPKNNSTLEIRLYLFALIIVLVGNSYVVKRILANTKTYLDWLVVVDSALCLGTIGK